MTKKRFTETVSTGVVKDNLTSEEYDCEMRIDDEFLRLVNSIAKENRQLKSSNMEYEDALARLEERNEQLKKEILWWKYRCGEDISGDVE